MNILLDSDESLISPHPEPYSGMLISDDDLKNSRDKIKHFRY